MRRRRDSCNDDGGRRETDHLTAPCLLLIEARAGRELVARCCERSGAAGVRRGMTVAHARALLPDDQVHVEHHDPRRDLAALRALAHWALRFSPVVAVDPPDGLLLDVTGCERLFRGEWNLVHGLADAVERLGFAARAAIAPTFGCAWAIARFGRRRRSLVSPDRLREALAPLPVRALRIDDDIEDALHEIAIDRVEHLFDLPRASIPARFGHDLLLRLDRALGEAIETIEPIRPAPPPVVERLFNGPVKQIEAIERTVHDLLDDLSRELLHRESGVRDLVLELDRSDLDPVTMPITLSRASRDAGHLWSLLRPHVERAHLGFGVERIEIAAKRTGRLAHEQMNVPEGAGTKHADRSRRTPDPRDRARIERAAGEMLDTMTNRLGGARVMRMLPVESHRPERAFRLVSVLDERDGFPAVVSQSDPGTAAFGGRGFRGRGFRGRDFRGRGVAASKEEPAVAPHDRPSGLFDHPEPVEVIATAPEGPPSWLRWRGRAHLVLHAAGPERLAAEWWREETPARRRGAANVRASSKYADIVADLRPWDTPPPGWTRPAAAPSEHDRPASSPFACSLAARTCFRVALDSGVWLWVCRDGWTGRWFVHGRWA